MTTKVQSSVSSDLLDVDKCTDEVDPRVQVTFLLQFRGAIFRRHLTVMSDVISNENSLILESQVPVCNNRC
jgi:hypothetical protein